MTYSWQVGRESANTQETTCESLWVAILVSHENDGYDVGPMIIQMQERLDIAGSDLRVGIDPMHLHSSEEGLRTIVEVTCRQESLLDSQQ